MGLFNKKAKGKQEEAEIDTASTEATDSSIIQDSDNNFGEFTEISKEDAYIADQVIESIQDESDDGMVLYIVVDKVVFGLINYFRENGVKVSNLFSDVTEAKNMILMQGLPTRIVVIDTGSGRFTSTVMRNEIIDMLGMADEQNKTTVFYSDSVLKMVAARELGKLSKTIDWIQYKSTAIVAATILQYNEKYIYDYEDENDVANDDFELLNYKGLNFAGKIPERLNINGFCQY